MGNHTLDLTKYAIVYARQSSMKQVEENIFSTESQRALVQVAESHGFASDNILLIDDDLGVSGRTIEKRVGMSRAIRLVSQGLVSAFYAEDMSRLSRDGDTVDQMEIARICKDAGVLLYMGGSWYDMRDSGVRMAYKYQAVGLSEMWQQHLEKLQRGKSLKGKEGRVIGRLPRGYRANPEGSKRDPQRDRAIIHEPEAAIIRSLAAQLPEAGSVRALFGRINPMYWPDGTRVTINALRHIFTSPIYRGIYQWGDITVENAHPAILTPEQARIADEIAHVNKKARRRIEGNGVELAGLVRCAECLRRMQAGGGQRGRSYMCLERVPGETHRYHFGIRSDILDERVRGKIFDALDQGLIDKILASLRTMRARAASVISLDVARIKSLERRRDGLIASLSDPDIGEASRKVILSQLEKVASELDQSGADLPAVSAIDRQIGSFEAIAQHAELYKQMRDGWGSEPLSWRRRMIATLVDKVEVRAYKGVFRVRVYYVHQAGGDTFETQRFKITPRGQVPRWSKEEQATVVRLMGDPNRPDHRWGNWIVDRLAEAGYHRTRQAVYTQVKLLGLSTYIKARPQAAIGNIR